MKFEIATQSSILLIDDDEDFLEVTKEALQGNFLNIYTATSGKKGIELIHLHNIDCIVCDFMMPEMNGAIFAKYIKANFPKVPVVILTGMPDSKVILDALGSFVFDMVAKPFDFEILINRICNAMIFPRLQNLILQIAEMEYEDFKTADFFKLSEEMQNKVLSNIEAVYRAKLFAKSSKTFLSSINQKRVPNE